MKIKCPGCGKVLNIPEAAAGKVVKCPCGKQLRAPGGAKPTAAKPQAQPAAAKPAAARPAAAKPVAQRTATAATAAAAPSLDDDLFGELTDNDLAPVKSVYSPGQAAAKTGGPSDDGAKKKGGKSVLKLVFGALAILGGLAMIGAFFAGVMGGDDEGDGIQIRRRSPLGLGIVMIITGFGWAASGFRGGSDEVVEE